MSTTLIFTEREKRQKLMEWGWEGKEVAQEEAHGSAILETRTTLWRRGNEKALMGLDAAFALELSSRILKLL